MPTFRDTRYGSVNVRRYARSRHVKVSLSPSGTLEISAPIYTPITFLRLFLKSSQKDIDALIQQQTTVYVQSQTLGRRHFIRFYDGSDVSIVYKKPTITITCPPAMRSLLAVQAEIKQYVVKALRSEAKVHLADRISQLAGEYGYTYETIRFTHSKSRWGSCNSRSVISLNIALMKLPDALIDYVLIHELAHTKEMNHGDNFWRLVAAADPSYKVHKVALRQYSPYI